MAKAKTGTKAILDLFTPKGKSLPAATIKQIEETATQGALPVEPKVSAAERAAAGRAAAELIKSQPEQRLSDALGALNVEGFGKLSTTQADRTRVGGGNIGGAAFPAISEADPNYAGKSWGVMDYGTASRLTNLTSPDTIWTTMLGSANQLKTNPVVFAKLEKQFKNALKEGKLSEELEAKINQNLRLFMGEGADIRDPKIWKELDTFEKRAMMADLMMGQGIAPQKGGIALGGEKSGKGVIFKPTETLIRETEPSLLHPEHGGNAPTFAIGPRLFTMEKDVSFRPDLHPGFPTLIHGRDLGKNVTPVPNEIALPDWHKRFQQLTGGSRKPGYYDLALGLKGEGLPSQAIDHNYLMHLSREGYAEGGMVETPAQEAIANTVQNPNAARMLDMDLANLALMQQQPQRMAEGGNVSSPEEKQRLYYEKRQKLPTGVIPDTGQADGVYQDPTVASETSRVFGMDPKADRLSILPRYSREEGLVAPQFVYEAAKAITAPSVAARGFEVPPEEAVNLAMNVAGAGYGAGAAMRNPTGKGGKDLGMFVGQKSNTWDMDKYEMALKMDRAGIDPSEINRYTGYFKNPSSNIWSQEISDASAIRTKNLPAKAGDVVPLKNVMRHENLFYAYPDLKDVKVTREAGGGASYYADKNTIAIGKDIKRPEDQLSALIHEAQHAIQMKERFPRGTNPKEMQEFITPEMAKMNQRMEYLNDLDKKSPQETKELEDLFQKMRKLKSQQKKESPETYMRAEGEAQARATEERRRFTEAQRRAIVPSASFDRPMSQLHQVYAKGGAVKMAEGGEPSQAELDRMRLELNSPVIQATPQSPIQRGIGTIGGYMDRAGQFVSKSLEPIAETHPVKHFLGELLLADTLKSAGTALQDYTKTSREYTEDNPYKRAPITGSGQTMSLDPRMLDVIGFAQPAASATTKLVSAGAKKVAPFAKDAAEMASELYMKGDVPFMPSPNMYAVSPDGKPSKVLAPANEIGFYSPTEAAALNLQRKSGAGQAFLNDIMKGENVRADEIKTMGLDTFLKDKKNVTADEVRDYIAQNKIQLGESVYDNSIIENPIGIPEHRPTKFSDYALPGGENYREIVLTLPDKRTQAPEQAVRPKVIDSGVDENGRGQFDVVVDGKPVERFNTWSEAQDHALELQQSENIKRNLEWQKTQPTTYKSSHWDEPNPLAHLRVSDRVTDGKKTLLVDEVQSDWHQAGREEGYKTKDSDVAKKAYQDYAGDLEKRYVAGIREKAPSLYTDPADQEYFVTRAVNQSSLKDMAKALGEEDTYNSLYKDYNLEIGQNRKGVPDAPYKDDWYQLTLRRAIKEAIDGGYDRVALPTGARVNERFDISKQIDRIDYNKNDDGTFSMSAIKDGREVFSKEDLDEKELSGIVGKDLAKKIVGDEGKVPSSKADRWESEDVDEPEFKSLSGLDLQIGGEGNKKYYDEVYPNYLKKFGKKYGAEVGDTKLLLPIPKMDKPTGWGGDQYMKGEISLEQYLKLNPDIAKNYTETVHYMDITPAMRKEFSTGIPMKRGGKVQFANNIDAMRLALSKG